MVMAALKNDFSSHRVAQELRNQWSDEDIRKRDQGGRHVGWWTTAESSDGDEDLTANVAQDLSDYNEEGQALLMDASEEAEHALALIEQGKRTLKAARERQHQVRMSRRYFKVKGSGKGSKGTSFSSSQESFQKDSSASRKLSCLRCGGDHATGSCPKALSAEKSEACEKRDNEHAPFVCYTEAADSENRALLAGRGVSTAEAVYQAKAVIGGGATRTLGSVSALERVMALNQESTGMNGIESIDLQDRPVFGFGNSSKEQCISTAQVAVQADGRAGHLRVHALDKGEGPILFSVESLRASGAVCDFEADLICFRKLNDRKVIQLERSEAGHQLLPLVGDWYEHAHATEQAVPSLKAMI